MLSNAPRRGWLGTGAWPRAESAGTVLGLNHVRLCRITNLQYAIQFTQGMQTSDADPRYLQASACCKHYVLNSMESTTEPDGESENRGAVNSNVTQQDLLDSYMAPFQDCVEQGKVSGLMCR